MKKKKQFLDYILTKLEPHGPIKARAMFGGYGIYYDTAMFACIVETVLYFRVDELNRPDYAPYQAKPFIYSGGPRIITLPYLELPQEILDNPEELPEWIAKSTEATIRYQATRAKKPSGSRKKVSLDQFKR